MNEGCAINVANCATFGTPSAIYGTIPILNVVLVCPLNRKNKGCVEIALIQAPSGSQASRFGIAMEEMGFKQKGGTTIALMSADVDGFRFVSFNMR